MEEAVATVARSKSTPESVENIERIKSNLQDYAIVPAPKLIDEQYHFILSRRDKINSCITEREKYLNESGIDQEIFGSYWGGEGIDLIVKKLLNGEREMYDRMRLVWNFSGFPIINYGHVDTFPVIDPIFQRYKKLAAASPANFKVTAPPVCGEAGWKVDKGVVNMDVAITQERLLFLYHTGVHDHLARKATPTIFEIGAGSGLFAYGLYNSFPKCRYIICDIPESLLQQFTYLNLGMSNKKHYVASPKGLFEIRGPEQEDKEVKYEDIEDGIIYVPNYMMHLYDKLIKPDLAYNAMSLHEMQPKQIDYYTSMLRRILVVRELSVVNEFWTKLENNQGVPGKLWQQVNKNTDPATRSWKRKLAEPIFKAVRLMSKVLGYQNGTHGIFFEVNSHRGHTNDINNPYLLKNFRYKKSFDFYDLSLCPSLWTNDKVLLQTLTAKHNDYKEQYDLDKLYQIDAPFQHPETPAATLLQMLEDDLGKYLGFNFTNWVNSNQYYFADHLDGYRRRFKNVLEF